jgi:DNA-binding GntR family transcriptional regulator
VTPDPRWSFDDEHAFESARRRIGALIAAYSARIGAAEAAGDDAGADRLAAASAHYQELRRSLSPDDKDEIARINAEFSGLLARVRAGEV